MVMNKIEVAEPELYVPAIPASKIKFALAEDYICAFGFPSFDLVVSSEMIFFSSDSSSEWELHPEVPFSIAHGHRLFLITTRC
jgi:hypothetical protein